MASITLATFSAPRPEQSAPGVRLPLIPSMLGQIYWTQDSPPADPAGSRCG